MDKIAEKVGLVSLREKPPDYGDLSIGPEELIEIANQLVKSRDEERES